MPSFKPREIVSILKKLGFIEKHQSGSHLSLLREKDRKIITVPIHAKDVKKGLLHGIIKSADSSLKEFLKLK